MAKKRTASPAVPAIAAPPVEPARPQAEYAFPVPPALTSWKGCEGDEIFAWAGPQAAARGLDLRELGRLGRLSATDDGRLLATVLDGQRQVATVWRRSEPGGKPQLGSACTCRRGEGPCEHAAALIWETFERLENGTEFGSAGPEDPRWEILMERAGTGKGLPADDRRFDAAPTSAPAAAPAEREQLAPQAVRSLLGASGGKAAKASVPKPAAPKPAKKAPAPRKKPLPRDARDRAAHEWLESLSAEQLREEIHLWQKQLPDLKIFLRERASLVGGDIASLVQGLEDEFEAFEKNVPKRGGKANEKHDSAPVLRRIQRLIDLRQPERVLPFGDRLARVARGWALTLRNPSRAAKLVQELWPAIVQAALKSNLSPGASYGRLMHWMIGDPTGTLLDLVMPIYTEQLSVPEKAEAGRTLAAYATNGAVKEDHPEFELYFATANLAATALLDGDCGAESVEFLKGLKPTGRFLTARTAVLVKLQRYEEAETLLTAELTALSAKKYQERLEVIRLLAALDRNIPRWDRHLAYLLTEYFRHPLDIRVGYLLSVADRLGCRPATIDLLKRFQETGLPPFQVKRNERGQTLFDIDPSWPVTLPSYLKEMLMIRPLPQGKQRHPTAVKLELAIELRDVPAVRKYLEEALKLQYEWQHALGANGDRWRVLLAGTELVAAEAPKVAEGVWMLLLRNCWDVTVGMDAADALRKRLEPEGRIKEWARECLRGLGRLEDRPDFDDEDDEVIDRFTRLLEEAEKVG